MITEHPDILLIEDNPLDVDLTLQAIAKSKQTQRVQVVRDGAEALQFFHRTGQFTNRLPQDDPKLIILDLKLPLVDGHYVLRQIVSDQWTKLIPLVVLTSSREPSDIYSTYKLGINSYVVKPVNSDTYISTMRSVVNYWLSVNQPPMA